MLLDAALNYLRSGLCVLPARLADKRPALPSWKAFQDHLPNEQQLRTWFADAEAICILCGHVSGNVEMIDFDQKGEALDAWLESVCTAAPDLLDRLVVERSQSGGSHVIYRCSEPVCGNIRLAERIIAAPDESEVVLNGKKHKPRRNGDKWEVTLTLIETRGQGGLFLCAPSPGYDVTLGRLDRLTVITPAERDLLLSAAYALNERIPQPEPITITGPVSEGRPGDDFNHRGDIRALLQKHGWSLSRSGENEYWRRPGKDHGTSATLKDGVLYVFSSNAAPFEQNKAYSPFGVYARLEHSGDYRKAAVALRQDGFGKQEETGVDLSGMLNKETNAEIAASNILTPHDLFHFNFADDPNTLLGNRWLCRAGACLVVGQTGIGKSSFSMQAMVAWALGQPVFGITPTRPLRSLIIQAENDVGDLSEMFCGVLRGTNCVDRLADLQPMLKFVSETATCGDSFHPWVSRLIDEHKPDLVWIDPLFAFLGGNASDQETVSKFLRNGLGTIAQRTGVLWMVVHHTNKPPVNADKRAAMVSSDFAYLGAGSAELANWARAVLSVREIAPSQFELRASKRGRRAGLVDVDGEPATEVFLKHGEQGICWERSAKQEDEREEIENDLANEVISAMQPDRAYERSEVRKLAQDVLGYAKSSLTTQGRRAHRVLQIILERTRNPLMPAFFTATAATQISRATVATSAVAAIPATPVTAAAKRSVAAASQNEANSLKE
jgi:hypothetical protein